MNDEVVAPLCTLENYLLSFSFLKKKKTRKEEPEPNVLYMCSSSGVKKALNQHPVKKEGSLNRLWELREDDKTG